MKYQINPIIDALSEVTKKLDVIPYEADLYDENSDDEDAQMEGTFNIFGLCEKHVKSMPTLDSVLKEKVLLKINEVYSETIKIEK